MGILWLCCSIVVFWLFLWPSFRSTFHCSLAVFAIQLLLERENLSDFVRFLLFYFLQGTNKWQIGREVVFYRSPRRKRANWGKFIGTLRQKLNKWMGEGFDHPGGFLEGKQFPHFNSEGFCYFVEILRFWEMLAHFNIANRWNA